MIPDMIQNVNMYFEYPCTDSNCDCIVFETIASAYWAIRAFVLLLRFERRFGGPKPPVLPLDDWRVYLFTNYTILVYNASTKI